MKAPCMHVRTAYMELSGYYLDNCETPYSKTGSG